MKNLTGQGKAQGAETDQDEPKFNKWQIEPRENGRKPIEIRTVDKLNGADVGILLCKTDQESDAKQIVKCMNNEWKIDVHDELMKVNKQMYDALKQFEEWMRSTHANELPSVKLCATIYKASEANEQLIKQAQQK